MPDGSPSCPTGSPATLTSRISTQPASVSIGAATPAVRGIDLHGHHHTRPGPRTEAGGLRDRPCALSPSEKTSNPGQAGPLVAAGSAPLEGLPPDVPPAARDRLAAALIPPSGVRRRRLDHRPAQLPGDPASEVLAWMAHALIAATRAAWVTPQTTPAATNPAARSTSESKTTKRPPAGGPPYRFARRSHSYRQPAAPSQARRPWIPAGTCAPPPTSPLNT
jgi:hypothetical protein